MHFFRKCDKCKRYYVRKWRTDGLQWEGQTVGALSYRRNNTGSIPDRTEKFFFILGMHIGSIQPAPTKIIIFFSPVR